MKRFTRKTMRLLLLAFGLMLAQRLAAQEADKTLSPYFVVVSEDAQQGFPLKATSADVNISGVIANVRVQQVYYNQGKKPIEAIYVFPSSTRAAVYSMNVRVGKRVLTAKIEEKEKARNDYDKAKKEGKSASLLEQERPNVFKMNVANIMPGDTVKVELCYTELLVPSNGEYELVYPTVVGPRYTTKVGKDEKTTPTDARHDSGWVANPYTHEEVKPMYTFDMRVVLVAGMPISEAACPSHKTNIFYDNASTAICQLDPKDQLRGNKDFVFRYRLSDSKVKTGLLLYEGKDENFFLAMIQPPKTVKPEEIPPREYIFILDVSGSMNGYPLEISQKIMTRLLAALKPSDKFNLLLFAGTSRLLADSSLSVNKENLEKALTVIKENKGSGGTELLTALKKAMAIPSMAQYSRSFVLLTDGYVDVEPESFQLVGQNLGKANFFALGIGTSVNRFLIEGLCRVGKAEPFVATSVGEADGVAQKFMDYIQYPVLSKIKTDYENISVFDVEPKSIPDAFVQRPILIFGKWEGKPHGTLRLTGQTGNFVYDEKLKFDDYPPQRANIALQYLWARNKIENISDYAGLNPSESIQKEVCKLGLKYNLLTNYTSFVAIDSVVVNGQMQSTTIKQALPLPEHVSDMALGMAGGSIQICGTSANLSATAPTVGSGVWNVGKKKAKISRDIEIEEKTKQDSIIKEIIDPIEEMPQYPGGEIELQKFIAKNLVYPKEAKEQGITGKVYVRFEITKKGDVKKIQIARSIHPLLDAEAIRIIKLLPRWTPGKQQGKPVNSWYTIPIEFKQ